jgi:hypothetical protein
VGEVEHFQLGEREVRGVNLLSPRESTYEDEDIVDPSPAPAPPIVVETWRQFEQQASDVIPCLVDGLWPESSLGFIAAPPKTGKTWIGLALALAVATGKPFLGEFHVPSPRPVLYVALEGHRSALRHRVGALARGLDLDPDSEQLKRLHVTYKPRGLNLMDPNWSVPVREAAESVQAQLVIVDVLRAAALMKENSADDVALLRSNLEPLRDTGASVALLHHFGKLTEISKDRAPGERMSGSGALFGVLDVGIYITGSSDGARKLRLAFDARDLATPPTRGVRLEGEGSDDNGGFTYDDSCRFTQEAPPDENDLKAPAPEIAEWIREQGGEAYGPEIVAVFDISEKTLVHRRPRLLELGIDYESKRGKASRYYVRPEAPAQQQFDPSEGRNEFGNDLGSGVRESSDLRTPDAWLSQNEERRDNLGSEHDPNSDSRDLQGDSSSGVLRSPTGSSTPYPEVLPERAPAPQPDTTDDPDLPLK